MRITKLIIALIVSMMVFSCQGDTGSKMKALFGISGSEQTAFTPVTPAASIQASVQSATQYIVGTGIYDVTGPAAELGMMGYSMVDQKTSGIHTRLRSRAYIIGDMNTNKRVVIVSADICMIFQSVKLKVTQMVRNDPELAPYYNEKNILLSGNHTHSGPGGYSHYATYNLSILGFDKQNFDAICNGIFSSIKRAHRNLEPGYIFVARGELNDCGWNRSINAYNSNPAAERARYGSSTDKTMTLLKIVSASTGNELGMINWFAVHPTSLGNTNTLISSDNKGLAEYYFEKMKNTDYSSSKTFTAAFAQTNSGDVSPNIYWGYPQGGESDFEHMEIIAQRQYNKAVELYNSATEALSGPIDFRHTWADFTSIAVDSAYAGASGYTTCYAAIGFPQIAGSTEDGKGVDLTHEGMAWGDGSWPSFTLVPGDQECQAEKIILLPAGRMTPYPWVPQTLPMQIIRIGNLALIAAPAEVTTMAGRRLRETVLTALNGSGINCAVISTHANTYTSYVTTREEYATQHYEGGSTQFGPYTLAAFQQIFNNLATAMKNGADVAPGTTPPDLGNVQNTLQTGVVFDDKPLFKSFGDVYSDASSSYTRGGTVSVTFWGGHPKNNLRIQDTFLNVERKNGSSWVTVANDWDPETRYMWKRDGVVNSKVTIRWKIPANAATGQYRIRHFGNWKSGWTGAISSYTGTSRTFTVN